MKLVLAKSGNERETWPCGHTAHVIGLTFLDCVLGSCNNLFRHFLMH